MSVVLRGPRKQATMVHPGKFICATETDAGSWSFQLDNGHAFGANEVLGEEGWQPLDRRAVAAIVDGVHTYGGADYEHLNRADGEG